MGEDYEVMNKYLPIPSYRGQVSSKRLHIYIYIDLWKERREVVKDVKSLSFEEGYCS